MSAIITRAGKGSPLTHNEVDANFTNLNAGKQENLVSGTTIKTVNGNSLLGAGDLVISGGGATNLAYDAATRTVSSDTGTDATLTLADGTNAGLMTSEDFIKLGTVATGATVNATDASLRDRTTHTGTQAASTIGNFNEAAQDAVGAMVGTSIVYDDTGATLQRAALTGAVTAAQNSNALALGSFTKAELDGAVSDGNVMYVGDAPTAHTHVAANVTDFSTAVAANSAVVLNTAKVTNATHTGDATGATALTLATVNSNVGSFGLAASVAQFTVNAKGLITAAVNVAISIASTAISDSTAAGRAFLTAATAAAQTALLDVFTSGAKGLAPASGGGTTNFLRADGTWAAAGGGSPVTVQDEGSNITTALGTLNFVGAGVTVTGGATSVVTIPGGGGSAEPLIGWFV